MASRWSKLQSLSRLAPGRVLLCSACALLCVSLSAGAQFPQQSGSGFPSDPSGRHDGEAPDPQRRQREEKLELERNEERQKQLVKDTNKLLALATELKEQVDKTNKDTMSVDVIKKADEIEKLAKNVRDRMKY